MSLFYFFLRFLSPLCDEDLLEGFQTRKYTVRRLIRFRYISANAPKPSCVGSSYSAPSLGHTLLNSASSSLFHIVWTSVRFDIPLLLTLTQLYGAKQYPVTDPRLNTADPPIMFLLSLKTLWLCYTASNEAARVRLRCRRADHQKTLH